MVRMCLMCIGQQPGANRESFCTVCEQPRVNLNPRPFTLEAIALTTAPRRQHTKGKICSCRFGIMAELVRVSCKEKRNAMHAARRYTVSRAQLVNVSAFPTARNTRFVVMAAVMLCPSVVRTLAQTKFASVAFNIVHPYYNIFMARSSAAISSDCGGKSNLTASELSLCVFKIPRINADRSKALS